ncbi:uncharacterized protein LOC123661408 [Melitaea cinxia]|uniref:uncharacterized protein LOC123661408 n=1 Tax=Melitaea cinxia TaxID=113334 RepID=UPI001E270B37|nr:uncharacterized protein LOC123661408 [Melitaea cinxia]
MEPLVEVPRSRWLELRDLYKINWPKNSIAYIILDTQISYPDLSEKFNFKVYCPYGDIHNGMVAIFDKTNFYDIMIHPVDNINKLEEALATTKVVNFTGFSMISSASLEVEECLKRVKNFNNMKGEKAITHLLNRDSPKFENLSIPPNTYIGQIKPEHIKFIDEKWTYHGKHTYKMFEALTEHELTYVLYSKEDQPLAWVTVNIVGALNHLYCIESQRRKGYAEFILKYAINDQLRKGKDTLAYTIENNFKAQNLFDKLKFQRIGCHKWLIIF